MKRLVLVVAAAATLLSAPSSAGAQTCAPAYSLGCGVTDSWGNDRFGSTTGVDSYGCPSSPAESGAEYAYVFVAPGEGEVTVRLSGLTADLDLYVIRDTGSGCDPTDCLLHSARGSTADESVTFSATAGATYYFVVDGYLGATSRFDLAVACAFAVPCAADWSLSCGESDSWDTTGTGHSDVVDEYSCVPWREDGNEYVYSFVAPADGTATATLSGISVDLDVFVLEATAGACDPGSCIAHGETSATFDMVEGRTYYIAVDGYLGAQGAYTIHLSCAPDGGCSPAYSLTCGVPDHWNNSLSGSTDLVNRYSCSTWDETGPEYAYSFVAPVDGTYSAALSGIEAGADLDVFVLDGSGALCDPAACVAYGSVTATWTGTAGTTYYVVVDGYAGDVSDYVLVVNCPALDVCLPGADLTCGASVTASTLDPAATDNVDRYSCSSWTETGPEMAYTFRPRVTADVTARLSGVTAGEDLDLFVLEGGASACDPDSCLVHGDLEATFHAVAGSTYYVVVDGYFGDAGDYTLTLDCAFGCRPRLDLACGALEVGDTRGSGTTDRLDEYSCVGWDESGPEYAYRYTALADGTVTVTIDGMTEDLDVFVVSDSAGSCDPSACLVFGDSTASFAAVAGRTYYIVVDGFMGAADEYLVELTCAAPDCDQDRDGYASSSAACGGTDCDDRNAAVNPGATEVCGDGVDQDCSGADLPCPGCTDGDGDGFGVGAGCAVGTVDCDDTNAAVHPGATEICGNGVDEDCSGADLPCPCADRDGDGFEAGSGCTGILDCDDTRASVHPGAAEVCGDGIDQDCDGADLPCGTCVDRDGDGYGTGEGCLGPDCDDFAAAINPGAVDVCGNGIDEDCSGADRPCPVDCVDLDGDGYGTGEGCLGPDCDDTDPEVHPGARDHCGDGIDQDCSGSDAPCTCDDDDGDGAEDERCGGTDCNDADPAIHPGATEVCGNGVDEDCDGVDDRCPCEDADGDGYEARHCGGDDCDDADPAINPGARDDSCDGVDQDCSGLDNCPCVDADGDGYGIGETCVGREDCDDADPSINPGAVDVCGDGIDQDCSGADRPCICADDLDGDGHVSAACVGGDDCDDSNAAVHPGADEVCANGLDDDCDGAVDEPDCTGGETASGCNCTAGAGLGGSPLPALLLFLLALAVLRRR